MKKGLKKAVSILLASVMTIGSVTISSVLTSAANADFTSVGGWYESAYAEWTAVSGADSYNVYYKASGASSYTKVDDELVRGTRVDVLGLKGGSDYNVKVVPVIGGAEDASKAIESDNISVTAFPREGFAFSKGKTSGGYNEDGTVPDNATIVYVTNDNKDSLTGSVVVNASKNTVAECTGISGILLAREKSGSETTPLIIRVIGVVSAPASGSWTAGKESKSNSGVDSAGLLNVKSTQNITIEGVGVGSGFTGFGLNVRDDSNIEIRNMRFGEQKDDCVSVQTDNDHIWVHHNDFYIGANGGGDKSKGDGSCDVKANSSYATVDYNHFHNTGKTSLGGMNSDSANFFLTYHHNWYDKSGSRHPRARVGSIHVYNNYFDHNYSGGIASCKGASVFSDSNYFEDTVRPMFISGQGNDIKSAGDYFSSGETGGVIKSYNNKLTTCDAGTVTYLNGELKEITQSCTGCTYWNGASKVMEVIANRTDFEDKVNSEKRTAGNYPDAYQADTRDEQVPASFATLVGGCTYNNFDTDSSVMADYVANVQSPDEAKKTVMANAGALRYGQVLDDPTITPQPETESTTYVTEASTEATTAVTESSTKAEETSTETTTAAQETVAMGEPTASDNSGTNSVTYRPETDDYLIHDSSDTAATSWEIPFEAQSNGKVTVSGTLSAAKAAGKWAMVQIKGKGADDKAGMQFAFASDDSKNLAVRVGDVYTSLGVAMAANTTYSYTFDLDLDNGKGVLDVDGKSVEFAFASKEISSIMMITAVGATDRDLVVTMPVVTKPAAETDDFVWGDTNGTKKIEAADAANVLQYVLNKNSVSFSAQVIAHMDVNADNSIDAADASDILQKALVSTFKFKAEK